MLKKSKNRIFGGVCGGVAEEVGMDPTILRLIVGLLFFCPYFPIGFVYIFLCIFMPEK
jgi:phage shock protein C